MAEEKPDILTQGKKYEPVNETISFDKKETEKTEESTNEVGDASDSSPTPAIQANPDAKPEDDGKNKKLLILGLGIAGIVILIIVAVTLASVFAKNKAKRDAERAEDLLIDEDEYVEEFKYTDEEKSALRAAGFTGDDIELNEFDEIPAQTLLEKAHAEREALYEKEILPYFDAASDEFKELYEDTWIGQGELEYDTDVDNYSYMNTTINVDYEKLPARGRQLFIKLHLKSGISCFMYIAPDRYMELEDSGNIVVKVEYVKTGKGEMIITNLTEIIP